MNIKEYVLMVGKRLPAFAHDALKKMIYLAGVGIIIVVIIAWGIQEISHRAERRRQRRSTVFLHLINGASFIGNDQIDEAILEFESAIKISPESENADAYYGLACAYKELEQYQKAAENFQRAIKLEPNYTSAWLNLGVVHTKMSMSEEAIKCYKKVILLEPNNLIAHFNLGNAYLVTGDKQAAMREYNVLIAADAKLTQKLENLIKTGRNDFEGAGKTLEKRRVIEDAKKYASLAKKYAQAKNYTKAIENFEAAVKIYPASAVVWSNLGVCYRSLEQWNKAIACYKKAIILKPDYALAYYNLSGTYFALGQKPAAMRGYNVVKMLDPKLAQDLLNYMRKTEKERELERRKTNGQRI